MEAQSPLWSSQTEANKLPCTEMFTLRDECQFLAWSPAGIPVSWSHYQQASPTHKGQKPPFKAGGVLSGAVPGFWSGGPSGVLTPREAMSPKFTQNRVFPLKLPENCMILNKSWGQGVRAPSACDRLQGVMGCLLVTASGDGPPHDVRLM